MTTIQTAQPMNRFNLGILQRANLQYVAKANQKSHIMIDQLLEKYPKGVVLQGVSLPLYEEYFEVRQARSPRRGKRKEGKAEEATEQRIKQEEVQAMEYEGTGEDATSSHYPVEPPSGSLVRRVDSWRKDVHPGHPPDSDPRHGVNSDENVEYPSSREASVPMRHPSPIIETPETKRLIEEMPRSDFARRLIDKKTGKVKRWGNLRPA
ncbi:hypothetical protein OE88DRAFT_220412 [Heliocybe sulcata]|uniref:Uncharacterized protein n=1 Tax=Heliocybe sulcata TaxID=5364 RepID=A0A5C3N4L5_9AGAM|nr:hypothetical protein OE88DRAFT_220412 [Heliocybe sulcata]